MNEFVLIDAAIWQSFPKFDAIARAKSATPLYADLPGARASRLGPWVLLADEFNACVTGEESCELPWRYGMSRLVTDATLASLTAHLESQRGIAMVEGDRYYLRFADTRAMSALARVLMPEQVQQLKGPVAHWRYRDRFGQESEFGAGMPADERRHAVIVLSDAQSALLLEQQLAGALADALIAFSDDPGLPCRVAERYRHVEASAAFVLAHDIDPFDVQIHVAAIAVKTDGAILRNARFVARVESVRGSGQWGELKRTLE
jgi:hypothetical protein